MRRLGTLLSLACLLLGVGALAATLYLWFGEWPRSAREAVDYHRSLGETEEAPPEPLIQHPGGREFRSLSGTWNAVIDPSSIGESPLTAGVLPRNVRAETASDLVEFSFEGGPRLEVPGDWNTQDERLFFYQGVVWYQRHFRVQRPLGRRVFLYFGAASYRASVFVNGRRVGGHEGGFTPFNFEITHRVVPGENLLVVAVDNRLSDEDVPVSRHDWLNYGGLTRDVWLLDMPDTFVRSWRLWLEASGAVRGELQLDGPGRQREASVALPELDAVVRVRTDATGFGEFRLDVRAERWSPETPRLYRLELRAGEDRVTDRVGFRTVEVHGQELRVNGEPVFLRGISLHEERLGPGGGRVRSVEETRALLEAARELGCNFVRLAHYPHAEAAARLADELGLFVWAEIPVYWNVAFDSPRALERARRQLAELVERDRNRASVILWSIGNETPPGEERNAFMASLAEHARALDPTRPITAALLAGPEDVGRWIARDVLPSAAGLSWRDWTYRVSDPLGEIVDVAALNEYFGWYYAVALAAATPLSSRSARELVLDHLPDLRLETGLDKPLIVSEFGAGALVGHRAPEEELAVFSEEYQALVYRRQLEMIARQPDVVGLSPWVLKDFRSPLRSHPRFQDYFNRKGLLSETGERKLAWTVLRDHYRRRAAP